MIHDLRSAIRSLRRAPGLLILVTVTLGLGIGGAASIFSLVNTLLLRPLPFEAETRLVRLRDAVSRPGEGAWRYNTSPRSFVAMREWGRIFEGLVAQRYRPMTLSSPGEPERVVGIGVSAGWTEVLGVGPVLGRPFSAEEEALGVGARVVLIGHELWQDRFGGREDVLGASVRLDDAVYSVVGVMPVAYNYPYGADLWVPDAFDIDDTAFGPNVVGRLRDGLRLEVAQDALDGFSRTLADRYPASHESIRLLAVPIRDDLVSNHPRLGLALLLGSGVLLLLACFNIANLLLVRGVARREELAIRAALGARAGRQVRQLLFESLALGSAGALVGLGVAALAQRLMARLSMAGDSSLGAFFTDLGLDWRVTAFALGLGAGTAILFGVLPALRAGRVAPRRVLAAAGRGVGPGRRRWLDGLIAAEMAVAFVLLAGAALMLTNLEALRGGDRGYATADRVVFQLGMTDRPDSTRVVLVDRLLSRLQAEPSVRAVGAVHHLPFDDGSSSTAYSVEDGPVTEGDRRLLANVRFVAGAYHSAMGIALVRGRWFTAEELRGQRDVVVVNRAFADRFWPDGPPGRVKLGAIDGDAPWLTVVGVVATVRENYEIPETLYLPYAGSPTGEVAVVAAMPGEGARAGVIRRAVREVDPGQPLTGLSTVEARLQQSLGSQTAATGLMAGFGGFGALLAALGIYGVMAHTVRRRRQELAVRQALGLTRAGAIRAVLLRALLLTALGVAIGLPAAVGFTGLLTELLGGTTRGIAIDIRLLAGQARLGAVAYLGLGVGLGVSGLAAAVAPALRAAATDPARTLRGP